MSKSSGDQKNLSDDSTSYSNLPQNVIIKKCNESNTFDEDYDDTLTGVAACIDHGKGKPAKFRHLEPIHKFPTASK
jgi:hypothetical protein